MAHLVLEQIANWLSHYWPTKPLPHVPFLLLTTLAASVVVPLFGSQCPESVNPAPEEPSVGRLVVLALQGEEFAIESLYRRHTPSLLGRVLRLLGDRSDAEDVVQDAFLQAMRELSSLREPEHFGAWLSTIAVRMCHRKFRRQRLLRQLGFGSNTGDKGLAGLAAPGVDAETIVLLKSVDRYLSKMPAKWRFAWMLRYVEGCPLKEVAEHCQCSLATAKRIIGKAQQTLGSELSWHCLPVQEGSDDA